MSGMDVGVGIVKYLKVRIKQERLHMPSAAGVDRFTIVEEIAKKYTGKNNTMRIVLNIKIAGDWYFCCNIFTEYCSPVCGVAYFAGSGSLGKQTTTGGVALFATFIITTVISCISVGVVAFMRYRSTFSSQNDRNFKFLEMGLAL